MNAPVDEQTPEGCDGTFSESLEDGGSLPGPRQLALAVTLDGLGDTALEVARVDGILRHDVKAPGKPWSDFEATP